MFVRHPVRDNDVEFGNRHDRQNASRVRRSFADEQRVRVMHAWVWMLILVMLLIVLFWVWMGLASRGKSGA